MQKEISYERILSFLGLATRAGKVVSGMDAVEGAMRNGIVDIVIAAEDASDKTKKNISYLTEKLDIPLFFVPDRFMLGRFLGKEERVVCGVLDEGFAKRLKQLFAGTEKEG